jgi:ribonuclease VapC
VTIDTSAVLAILQDESEREEFVSVIERASERLISAVSVLAASMVLESRKGESGPYDLDDFLRSASIRVMPFDDEQLAIARVAFRRFGRGRHSATLNFGDCASYALAKWSGEPLLFKGTAFPETDIARVRD